MLGNRTTLSFEIENLRLFNSKLHNMGLFSFITNSKIAIYFHLTVIRIKPDHSKINHRRNKKVFA